MKTILQVSHQFSHIHHTYKVWSGKLADGIDAGDSAQGTDTLKWVTRPQLKDTAIPTGMVKVGGMVIWLFGLQRKCLYPVTFVWT